VSNAFDDFSKPEGAALRTEVLCHAIFALVVLVGATLFTEFLAVREKFDEVSSEFADLSGENKTALAALKLANAHVLDQVEILVRHCDYIGIPTSAMNKVWIDHSLSIKRYYWATNSIALNQIYIPEWRQPGIEAQARAVAKGADVRKVLFHQTPGEAKSKAFRDEIARQRSLNLKLRSCDEKSARSVIPKETLEPGGRGGAYPSLRALGHGRAGRSLKCLQ
jgi:hypothetical protein